MNCDADLSLIPVRAWALYIVIKMAAESEVSQLFGELEQCEITGNYFKGLKVANKSMKKLFISCCVLGRFAVCYFTCFSLFFLVLEKVANDKDAFQCKIVCFIQQGKLHDALQMLRSWRVKKGLV